MQSMEAHSSGIAKRVGCWKEEETFKKKTNSQSSSRVQGSGREKASIRKVGLEHCTLYTLYERKTGDRKL